MKSKNMSLMNVSLNDWSQNDFSPDMPNWMKSSIWFIFCQNRIMFNPITFYCHTSECILYVLISKLTLVGVIFSNNRHHVRSNEIFLHSKQLSFVCILFMAKKMYLDNKIDFVPTSSVASCMIKLSWWNNSTQLLYQTQWSSFLTKVIFLTTWCFV